MNAGGPSRPGSEPPAIDYLARDYASFRRLMLETMERAAPEWRERNPADLGVAVVEVLAYAADQLAYLQDAVATEAYLDTARRRSSVRRHLRLIGYHLHEGCTARAWVQVEPSRPLTLPAGTPLMVRSEGLPAAFAPGSHHHETARRAEAPVFETLHPARLDPGRSGLRLHALGGGRVLPAGATRFWLAGHVALEAGTPLLLRELGPGGGRAHVVRALEPAEWGADPRSGAPITALRVFEADALPFELAVAGEGVHAVAEGNLVAAEHGETVSERLPPPPAAGPYRPALGRAPVAWAAPFDPRRAGRRAAAWVMDQRAGEALPRVELIEGSGARWRARRDLLGSDRLARELCVETEDGGGARLRFGDGALGARPAPGIELHARYRIGGGTAGLIGSGVLGHCVTDLPVVAVHNPLPARGGEAPEPAAQARALAPWIARQPEACATPADCARRAEQLPEVRRAAAFRRRKGGLYTEHLYVQRRDGGALDPVLRWRLRRHLEPRLAAGHALVLGDPRWVPLALRLRVVVAGGSLRESVAARLREALAGDRGPLHPGTLGFGEALALGAVLDRAAAVEGVDRADAERFRARAAPPQVPAVCDRVPAPPEGILCLAPGAIELAFEGGR